MVIIYVFGLPCFGFFRYLSKIVIIHVLVLAKKINKKRVAVLLKIKIMKGFKIRFFLKKKEVAVRKYKRMLRSRYCFIVRNKNLIFFIVE
jgi:hypothetical protein